MAGSLGGRAWRVRRLEGLDRDRQSPARSRTEEEAQALDAEIRALDEEMEALDADPNWWRHVATDRAHLTLDEHIVTLEKETGDDDDH